MLDNFRAHRQLVEDEARVADMVENSKERTRAQEERDKVAQDRHVWGYLKVAAEQEQTGE